MNCEGPKKIVLRAVSGEGFDSRDSALRLVANPVKVAGE